MVDFLNVVVVFELVDELEELDSVVVTELDRVIRDVAEFSAHHFDTSIFESLGNGVESFRRSGDFMNAIFGAHVFCASFENEVHDLVFRILFSIDDNHALVGECPRNGTGFTHGTVVLVEDVTDFSNRTDLVVGHALHHDSNACRAASFVQRFRHFGTGVSTRTLGNSTFDVLGRQALALGLEDCSTETRVCIRVAAAELSSDGDFLNQLVPSLSTSDVGFGFLAFGGGPFRMTGHRLPLFVSLKI